MFRTEKFGEVTVSDLLKFDQKTLLEFFGNAIEKTEAFTGKIFEKLPQHPQKEHALAHLRNAQALLEARKYFAVNRECAKALLATFGVSQTHIKRCEEEAQWIAREVLRSIEPEDISNLDKERILEVVTQDIIVAYPRLMVEGYIYEIENFRFSNETVVQMVEKYSTQIRLKLAEGGKEH